MNRIRMGAALPALALILLLPAIAAAQTIDTTGAVQGLASLITATFPVALPYITGVTAAASLFTALVPAPASTSRWFVPYHLVSALAINLGNASNKGVPGLLDGIAQAYLKRNGLAAVNATALNVASAAQALEQSVTPPAPAPVAPVPTPTAIAPAQ